jgi:hypothetical protein
LIPVDKFTPLVNSKKAVGVAVERKTKCSTACNYRPLQIFRMRRSAGIVDVSAIGLRVQYVNLEAETTKDSRRNR